MITPSVGSHMGVLSAALDSLGDGSLVIEHGAGLYSSVLIRDSGHRAICIERDKDWAAWAAWLYGAQGEVVERAKRAMSRLVDASLVFVDGAMNERGDLLRWAIEARVPTIIAHDTEDDSRKQYGYVSGLFSAPGYQVTSEGKRPQTTVWRLR